MSCACACQVLAAGTGTHIENRREYAIRSGQCIALGDARKYEDDSNDQHPTNNPQRLVCRLHGSRYTLLHCIAWHCIALRSCTVYAP